MTTLKIEKLVFDGLPRYLAEEERWLIVDDVVRLLRLNGGSYWIDGHFNLYVTNVMLDQDKVRPVLLLDDPHD